VIVISEVALEGGERHIRVVVEMLRSIEKLVRKADRVGRFEQFCFHGSGLRLEVVESSLTLLGLSVYN
jgi:hypothetical protein